MLSVRAVTQRMAVVLAAIAVVLVPTAPDAAARTPRDGTPAVTDLGEPVHKYLALSTAFGTGPGGAPQAYLLMEGNPVTTSEFAVVDLRTRRTVLDQRLPRGSSSGRTMEVSPVDGTVYFGATDTGDLYRYRPGAAGVEYLGATLPGQRLWELAVGTDGTVWGGTYPGGRLFSYTPSATPSAPPSSGRLRDYGQAVPGEQYIEAITQAGDDVYVGTEPNAKLARLNLATGRFTQVPTPTGHAAGNIDELNVRRGLLFVTSGGTIYVRDLATDSWADTIKGADGRGVSPVDPATGHTLYLHTKAGKIVQYDLDTKDVTATAWAPNALPESWGFVDLADPAAPGLSVAFTAFNHGRIFAYNFGTRRSYSIEPAVTGSADQLVSVAAGPDGDIYAGAYLTPPGMARWDPRGGAFELLTGSGQVEGFGSVRGDLVFGRYPQGALYRYDLARPWKMGTNPGEPATIGNEQNRPQRFVSLGTRVAVTSVPVAGRHGGAITLWNPETGATDVYRDVVANQTPVSLVRRGRLLYGGTSINGGYGIDPVTPAGRLFAWDPGTHQTGYETVPVPGAGSVSGLVVDETGLIWGIADSVLFAFDPDRRQVVRRTRLFDDRDDSRFGEDHVLVLEGGRLYGITANRLFSYDRLTGVTTVLYDGPAHGGADPAAGSAHDLAADHDGNLYFVAATTHLYRYEP